MKSLCPARSGKNIVMKYIALWYEATKHEDRTGEEIHLGWDVHPKGDRFIWHQTCCASKGDRFIWNRDCYDLA